MKVLLSEIELGKLVGRDLVPCECYSCSGTFYTAKRHIKTAANTGQTYTGKYCTKKCMGFADRTRVPVNCKECGVVFEKIPKEIKKSINHFCSKSCAVTYNNAHKTHGTRRSKLEVWLEQQLPFLFPTLEFHFNRKDAINSELDIYIPSLKLAFELNGLFHYEPIFGVDKLNKIQNNDQRKHAACYEAGIEMCWIDVSQQKYFKPTTAKKYLDIIYNLIQEKVAPEEIESSSDR